MQCVRCRCGNDGRHYGQRHYRQCHVCQRTSNRNGEIIAHPMRRHDEMHHSAENVDLDAACHDASPAADLRMGQFVQ